MHGASGEAVTAVKRERFQEKRSKDDHGRYTEAGQAKPAAKSRLFLILIGIVVASSLWACSHFCSTASSTTHWRKRPKNWPCRRFP